MNKSGNWFKWILKKLLKTFPKYDKKQFANVIIGDEGWVHYYEPITKVCNKIGTTKHNKHPIHVIAKRSSRGGGQEAFLYNFLLWRKCRNKVLVT